MSLRYSISSSGRGIAQMAKMTDEELEKLQDGFETASLLRAIEDLDKMRGYLNDRPKHQPPELRDALLKLHQLGMAVVNDGDRSRAEEFFDLAMDIDHQVFELT